MKNRLFLYLFMFSVLTALFIYVSSNNIINTYEIDIRKLKTANKALKDSVKTLNIINDNLAYFSLNTNEESLSFFEAQGINTATLEQIIKDTLLASSETVTENDLIPFDSQNSKMLINKIRILNHKWLIADFSDGTFWGEIFLSYTVNTDKSITFNLEKSFLYPAD